MKRVHLLVQRTRVVADGDPHVACAGGGDDLALGGGAGHHQALRGSGRAALLDLGVRQFDGGPAQRPGARLRWPGWRRASGRRWPNRWWGISEWAARSHRRGPPAKVEDGHRAGQPGEHELEVGLTEGRAAGGAQIGQPGRVRGSGRWSVFTPSLVVRKLRGRPSSAPGGNIPDQEGTIRVGRRGWRAFLLERRGEEGCQAERQNRPD